MAEPWQTGYKRKRGLGIRSICHWISLLYKMWLSNPTIYYALFDICCSLHEHREFQDYRRNIVSFLVKIQNQFFSNKSWFILVFSTCIRFYLYLTHRVWHQFWLFCCSFCEKSTLYFILFYKRVFDHWSNMPDDKVQAKKLPQFFAAISICMGAMGTGTIIAWTSNIAQSKCLKMYKETIKSFWTWGVTIKLCRRLRKRAVLTRPTINLEFQILRVQLFAPFPAIGTD